PLARTALPCTPPSLAMASPDTAKARPSCATTRTPPARKRPSRACATCCSLPTPCSSPRSWPRSSSACPASGPAKPLSISPSWTGSARSSAFRSIPISDLTPRIRPSPPFPSASIPRRSPNRKPSKPPITPSSKEHTSELQSLTNLVCRLLLEKKKKTQRVHHPRQAKYDYLPIHADSCPEHHVH